MKKENNTEIINKQKEKEVDDIKRNNKINLEELPELPLKAEKKKESTKIIRKKILNNVFIVLCVMVYLSAIIFVYKKIGEDKIIFGTKIISLVILFSGIIIFEIAYRKDSGTLAINGVEVLFLALYTLSISHIKTQVSVDFNMYILYSTSIFIAYYILKMTLIFANEKRKFVNSLSDVHEILIREPVKKVARRKRNR